jgi:hypothetical protein
MSPRVPVSPPWPERVPTRSSGTVSRVPLPVGDTGTGRESADTTSRPPTVSRQRPRVEAALANALRRVNAAYTRTPPARRPDPGGPDPLEAELDAALLGEDRDRALNAIRSWRDAWLRRCEEAR